MAFVPDVESDENGRDLLNNAGVLKSSSIQSANSGNFSRQFANPPSSIFVIAANDHVTIDRAALMEQVGSQVVKRGDHCYPVGHKLRSLLRRRALPDSESARVFAANACRQRDGSVDEYLSSPQ